MIEIANIRPLRDLLLVRRYERPEQVRGIWIPEVARFDDTQSLWEVVACGPKVGDVLGHELEPDTIIQTRPWRGHFIDEKHAIIAAAEVLKCITWRK